MKEILVAKDLFKIYGDTKKVHALDGVSITINEGDFVCVMGPSGNGKTTLLNILATVDRPTHGSVEINGKNINMMSEKEISNFRYENIGFIFQEFNLIDTLTLKENIVVPLVLAKIPKDEIRKKLEAISEKLGISDILDKLPSQCSGGQKQRATAARALITEPSMIVADEPTASLDIENSQELLNIIKERNEKEGIAVLMVTHDSMIASYSNKLMYLKNGKIDTFIEKGNLNQEEYYYKIADIVYKNSRNIFKSEEKTI